MKKIRNFTLLFSILFLGLMFVACAPIDDATTNGSSYNTSDSAGPMNCAIIYSEHSNSTKSISGLEKYIHGAKEASGYLGIVKLDGSPSVISNISEQTKMNSENETRQKGEIAEYVNNKMDELNKVKAEKEEVDILGSFKVANECFKKANNNDLENTVVFVGSGISTKGAIDFTSTGLDSLNLNDYISWVEKSGQLPKLDKVERVIWYNFDKVSSPQAEFPTEKFTEQLKDFYIKLLSTAGVPKEKIEFETSDQQDSLSSGLPKVSPVTLPPKPKYGDDPDNNEAQISSDVLFYGDSSQFKTDPKTNGDVKDIVYSMNADSALVVTITGYTANYQTNAEGGNESLAKNRAEAMKRVLVELGISEDRIVTEGVGKGWRDGTGAGIDEDNRCVKFNFRKN